MGISARAALLPLLLAIAAACGGSSRSARPRTGQISCQDADVPYSVTYPAGWYEDGCRRFDPSPLDEGRVERDAAITIATEHSDVDSMLRDLAGPAHDILDRKRVQVAGRPAVRLRLRATRDARLMLPGTLITEYMVQLPGRVLVARASGRPGSEFTVAEDTLDRMIFSLRLE